MGKQILSLPSCHSTNDIIAKLVPEKRLFEGAVVVTDHQTSGKGQRGNSWEAAPGKNLTFSVLLHPTFLGIEEQFYLYIVTALGITDFLQEYIGEGLKVKWPNDIYYFDKKLGGVLIENTVSNKNLESTIVGIGLNINQLEFSTENAVSLSQICNQQFNLEAFLNELIVCLEGRYLELKKAKSKKLMSDYLSRLYWYNEERVFYTNGYISGKIIGLDEMGRLKILSDGKTLSFSFKEVSFIK